MNREKFAFDKTNFILLAAGMAVVILGFLLMTGPIGFVSIIYAVVRKPKSKEEL